MTEASCVPMTANPFHRRRIILFFPALTDQANTTTAPVGNFDCSASVQNCVPSLSFRSHVKTDLFQIFPRVPMPGRRPTAIIAFCAGNAS